MNSALQDLMRDEHRLDEHARHLLRMQHRKLHTELTKLESGVYQCSTEYLEAHRKDLPGERAELTRFRRHSIATWYRPDSTGLGKTHGHPLASDVAPDCLMFSVLGSMTMRAMTDHGGALTG
jgi:hypothetical protein